MPRTVKKRNRVSNKIINNRKSMKTKKNKIRKTKTRKTKITKRKNKKILKGGVKPSKPSGPPKTTYSKRPGNPSNPNNPRLNRYPENPPKPKGLSPIEEALEKGKITTKVANELKRREEPGKPKEPSIIEKYGFNDEYEYRPNIRPGAKTPTETQTSREEFPGFN